MSTLKPILFWLTVLTLHGCCLSSDLEIEQRLAAEHARIQADWAREAGHHE